MGCESGEIGPCHILEGCGIGGEGAVDRGVEEVGGRKKESRSRSKRGCWLFRLVEGRRG